MRTGDRIKSMRTGLKLSQSRLSQLCGLPRSTVIRIENGEVDPRLSTLRKIAKALRVETRELVG